MTEKVCPECDGEGVLDQGTEDERRCPTCNGSGVVPDDGQDSEEVWNTHPERARPMLLADFETAPTVGDRRTVRTAASHWPKPQSWTKVQRAFIGIIDDAPDEQTAIAQRDREVPGPRRTSAAS